MIQGAMPIKNASANRPNVWTAREIDFCQNHQKATGTHNATPSPRVSVISASTNPLRTFHFVWPVFQPRSMKKIKTTNQKLKRECGCNRVDQRHWDGHSA